MVIDRWAERPGAFEAQRLLWLENGDGLGFGGWFSRPENVGGLVPPPQ